MTLESRWGFRLVVKAKGRSEPGWWMDHPPVIPRCGDFVKFDDGQGRVERVTWDVRAEPMPTVTVECVAVVATNQKQASA